MTLLIGYNDLVLLVSLLYSTVDLRYEWDSFGGCNRPVHWWLLVSYASVVLFRAMHLLGTETTAGNGHFLLDLRQKGTLPRLLVSFTWFVALPFFVTWTGVGTHWLVAVMRHSPQCVPTQSHLGFILLWLLLSYVWIIIHAALGIIAWVLEFRLRRAEVNLREVEDSDTIARWGNVSTLTGYRALTGIPTHGLTPAEINALPLLTAASPEDRGLNDDGECSICLNEIFPGDCIRRLSVCGHAFHRSCIDLWLLRQADCPLCKRSVGGMTQAERRAPWEL